MPKLFVWDNSALSSSMTTFFLRFPRARWGRSAQLQVQQPAVILCAASREHRLNQQVLKARERWSPDSRILFFYSDHQIAEPISGLRAGDDVVIFPLEKAELIGRLKQTAEPRNDARKLGKTARPPVRDRLEFVGHRSSVRMNGVETNLTKNEFKLLVLLASHIDQLVEFGDLSAVIGHHDSVKSGNLRTYISQLRTKVPLLREKLVAVEGYGFRLTGVAVVAPELGPELGI